MEYTEIRISEQLKKTLCREGIDISSACEVVEFAEESLEKVFDEDKGLWYAHRRIGNITLWVSYAAEKGHIEIKDVYMHRMEIEEGKE